MSSKNRNYQNCPEEKKGKKKYLLLLLLLLFAALLTMTLVAAYFSDIFTKTINIKTGTLTISGSYTFNLNGKTAELEDIKDICPGDVIVVKGTVSNTGKKSAWVRDMISINGDETLLQYLEVYEGEYTQAGLLEQPPTSFPLSPDNEFVGGNKVINGSGPDAEAESGEDYNFIEDYKYDIILTIYFLPSAGNETQGKPFELNVSVKALQFRNNNASEPGESAWSAVTAAPKES